MIYEPPGSVIKVKFHWTTPGEIVRSISCEVNWSWTALWRQKSYTGLCSTHFFGKTRLWLIWQSRWLNSDSTQIPNLLTWLNSDSTQNPILLIWLKFWLSSFESELSQIWLTTHHILPNLAKSCWPRGRGVRSNAAVGWFILCKATDKCKIVKFSLHKNPRLNFDSSSIQLTQLWLK